MLYYTITCTTFKNAVFRSNKLPTIAVAVSNCRFLRHLNTKDTRAKIFSNVLDLLYLLTVKY